MNQPRRPLPRHVLTDNALDPGTEDLPSNERWLLSYADFMTLLLALFVVLYATARVESDETQVLFEGLQAAFLFEESSPAPFPSPPLRSDVVAEIAEEELASVPYLAKLEEDLIRVIEEQPQQSGAAPGIELHQTERGLVVSLSSTEFFPAGGIAIPPERQAVLAAMAPFLNATKASVHFEGHTDNQPLRSGPFPSNWELSTARAGAVARYFMDQHALNPRRVATSGFAEFRPIDSGTGAAARGRNRRVEIVILKDAILVAEGSNRRRSELDQLLEALPPIPEKADESLRPPAPGPPPRNLPLP